LAFQNRSELSFLTVKEWKSRADMTPPLQLSEQQSELINTIRNEIRGTRFKHIRLIGEPGLGKTRLALESVTAEDIAPQVLYVPHAEDFQRGQLFNDLMRQESYGNVLLVIDECSEKDRASIWNA
jgi:Holliday junction resolvasome RuvABC ATP-dependent DNA helicase subunit